MSNMSKGKKMKVYGITGSIACGKSTVTRYLVEKGYKVVDADFFIQMEHQYNNLTTQNLLILMLKHIGKSDDEISDLLCVSKGSLRSYMSRIKRCRI